MSSKTLLKKAGIVVLMCGTLVATIAPNAQAWPGWRTEELGTATIADNSAYSNGKLPTPPWNRDALCRWKTGRSDAKGQAKSWFGKANWETRCYRTY